MATPDAHSLHVITRPVPSHFGQTTDPLRVVRESRVLCSHAAWQEATRPHFQRSSAVSTKSGNTFYVFLIMLVASSSVRCQIMSMCYE